MMVMMFMRARIMTIVNIVPSRVVDPAVAISGRASIIVSLTTEFVSNAVLLGMSVSKIAK